MQRTSENPFFIGNGRAMVSLWPLHQTAHCPYGCAFCYVQKNQGGGSFLPYLNMEIAEIISYLQEQKDKYDIVYISGDTDSFAPPRTEKGLALLKAIADSLDTDILFTTRTTFSEEQLQKIAKIATQLSKKGKMLISSVSISRLHSGEHLEPAPIPSPTERIALIQKLKELSIITTLAVRPFLPIIPAEEYIEIINKCTWYADVVLWECRYTNEHLLKRVFLSTDYENLPLIETEMDFDTIPSKWKCREAKETKQKVSEFCEKNAIPFFMRSKLAVEYLRKKYS